MYRREVREFISPLLQPPLNRLFIPRPTPDYLQPADKEYGERRYVVVEPTSKYMDLFTSSSSSNDNGNDTEMDTGEIITSKGEEKSRQAQEELETKISSWDPLKNPSATTDAFKTIFVGRLPYDITESRLRREFSRFGAIKSVKVITDTESGKGRGYAFIEFEREKDGKAAYLEGDGMRIEGANEGNSRRIVVDVERGRTVKGWRPRRLGGGLGRTREGSYKERVSGRDPRANDVLESMRRHSQSQNSQQHQYQQHQSRDHRRY